MLLPHRVLLILYRFPREMDLCGVPVRWVSGVSPNCGLCITKGILMVIVEHTGGFPVQSSDWVEKAPRVWELREGLVTWDIAHANN